MPPVLVAPDAFAPALRAAQVAGALARGLDAGGWEVDPCALAGGGPGTIEALLLGLGGDTAAATLSDGDGAQRQVGFGLLDGGGTAILEAATALDADGGRPRADSTCVGELILAAAASGAAVIVLAAAGAPAGDEGAGAAEAIGAASGLDGARLVVLRGRERAGLAPSLAAALEARLEFGPAFVLDALDFDARMRAARCVVVGAARLDDAAMRGGTLAEAATRARQAGVPCHAVVAVNALDRFGARILDLQAVLEAATADEIEAAGRELATLL